MNKRRGQANRNKKGEREIGANKISEGTARESEQKLKGNSRKKWAGPGRGRQPTHNLRSLSNSVRSLVGSVPLVSPFTTSSCSLIIPVSSLDSSVPSKSAVHFYTLFPKLDCSLFTSVYNLFTMHSCSLVERVHSSPSVHSHSPFPCRFCSLTRIFCFFRIYVPWEPLPTRTDCSPPIPVRPGGCPLSSLARLRISVPLSSLSAAPTRSLRVVAHYHEMFPRMSCSPGAATGLTAPHQPSA